MAAIRPGAPFTAPHEAAVRILAQGMVDLKLLEGSVDGVIESEAYKRFFMHRTGNWLGLDVHDAGDYKESGSGDWRPLIAGMVMTVEPMVAISALPIMCRKPSGTSGYASRTTPS